LSRKNLQRREEEDKAELMSSERRARRLAFEGDSGQEQELTVSRSRMFLDSGKKRRRDKRGSRQGSPEL